MMSSVMMMGARPDDDDDDDHTLDRARYISPDVRSGTPFPSMVFLSPSETMPYKMWVLYTDTYLPRLSKSVPP